MKPGLFSFLEKNAARAGLRLIRQNVASGNFGAANRLAQAPGVLKPTAAGSQIKHLGSGMEGTSTLVAHPQHGLAVRKVYDPQGISGPDMVARKAEAGRALQGSPDVARFHGEMPTQIGPAHMYEHVQSQPAQWAQGSPNNNAATADRVRQLGSNIGMRLHDVHEGNVVGGKIVDYLPVKPGAPTGLRTDVMERAEAAEAANAHGVNHTFTNYLKDPRRPGNLMAQAFRGAAPINPETSPNLLKEAASPIRPQDTEFLDEHFGVDPKWKQFRKNTKTKAFVEAVKQDTRSDEKLKRYSEANGKHLRARGVPTFTVPSQSSNKSYTVKYHPDDGRFSCSCGDWIHARSHQTSKPKQDCKHVWLVKNELKQSGTDIKSMVKKAALGMAAAGILAEIIP